MNFSIILPTRERPDLLQKLLNSIKDTTEDLDRIEVLLAIDEGDPTAYAFLQRYDFVRYYIVPRSFNFSKDYYSYLAHYTKGRWIIPCNDDAQFETNCWDAEMYGILSGKPNVILGLPQDGMELVKIKQYTDYSAFPVIGRLGYEALGYIFPTRLPIWGTSVWISQLYTQIGSVIKLPTKIIHYSHHNKTRPIDHINWHVTNNQGITRDPLPTQEEFEKLLLAFQKVETVRL